MTNLVACPHCGATTDARVVHLEHAKDAFGDYAVGQVYVLCDFRIGGCGASGGVRDTENEATSAWNRRGAAVEPEADPMPDMAHLDAVQLRRIIARHVRFREEAVRLLQQVDTGYEGEWPEIRQFLERVNARLVLAQNRRGGV